MTKTFATAALASASLIALATPAGAQDSAQQGATISNSTSAPTAASGPENSSEIVVTATRRSERLQDVPLAVNAISGDQLAKNGFKSLIDIQYQFSGVQFGTSPNDAGFRLRGVGTAGGFSSASEQNVGTVVDNVVVPFGNPVSSLGDLDRVEVLKGPQGTQFGKNSSSGVVNITTRKPNLNRLGASAFVSAASLGETDIHGSVNVPIVPGQMAINVYAFHRYHDGFIDNVVLNEKWGAEKNYGFRAKLLWAPTSDFSAYIIGDWSNYKRKGPGQLWTINRLAVPIDLAATDFFSFIVAQARFGAIAALGITPGLNNDKSAEEYEGFGGERNYGASIELNKGLGAFNLTSITAYRKLDTRPNNYAIDGMPFPIFTAQENGVDQSFLSQEIRLTSPKGHPLEYVAGIYLSRRKSGYGSIASAQLEPVAPLVPVTISITNGLNTTETKTDSAAAFVDGTFRLTPQLRLLGGFRYSYDWVTASNFSTIDPAHPPQGLIEPYDPRPLQVGKVHKGDWSGRTGIEYKPTADIMLYGTIARGYLGPTVTFSGLSGTRSDVAPQTVRDITLGFKTQWLDKKLTFNGNVFYDKYKDLQTSVFNGFEFLTENAGGLTAKGFELETVIRPVRQLSLNGSVTYSKTKFTDYVTSCPNSILAQDRATILALCNAPGSIAPVATNTDDPRQIGIPLFQAEGYPLAGAPKWSFSAGANFNQPVGDHLLFDASVNYYHRSKVYYDVANELSTQKGYGIFGGTVGIGEADGRWRLAVFARNLFDKRFVSSVIGLPFSPPGSTVNWLTREGRRTVGASIEARF